MMLTRINTIPTIWREFDELFRDLSPRTPQVHTLAPATDVHETEKTIEFRVDLPGVAPDAIEVKLEGNVLTLAADRADEQRSGVRRERSWGRFSRSFTLPETVDGASPEASYKHGVLTVTLAKKELAQPRSFKVKVDA